MNNDLFEVRCHGCHDLLGYAGAPNAVRRSVYCTKQCAREGNVHSTDERTAAWERLIDSGMTGAAIARRFGVTHRLVYKMLGR